MGSFKKSFPFPFFSSFLVRGTVGLRRRGEVLKWSESRKNADGKKFENAQKCFVLISVVTQAFPDFSLQSSNFSAHPRLKLWSWIERSPFFESQEENPFRS